MKRLFALLAPALALVTFAVAAYEHLERDYSKGLFSMWNDPQHVVELFLFISPCIIFLITTLAYYRFIVNYTGEIAGWSFVGFLAASYCCEQLLEASPSDWASHLFWVYCLFWTYAWWDAVMLLWLLPRSKNRRLAAADDLEIYTITSMVNWPTLGGLFLIWLFARHLAAQQSGSSVSCYVNGVVAFHLVFASFLAGLNMRFTALVEEPCSEPAEEEQGNAAIHR